MGKAMGYFVSMKQRRQIKRLAKRVAAIERLFAAYERRLNSVERHICAAGWLRRAAVDRNDD